jgi:hypothetical protein
LGVQIYKIFGTFASKFLNLPQDFILSQYSLAIVRYPKEARSVKSTFKIMHYEHHRHCIAGQHLSPPDTGNSQARHLHAKNFQKKFECAEIISRPYL